MELSVSSRDGYMSIPFPLASALAPTSSANRGSDNPTVNLIRMDLNIGALHVYHCIDIVSVQSQDTRDISEDPLAVLWHRVVVPGEEPSGRANELSDLRSLVLCYLGNKLSSVGMRLSARCRAWE
jgi:hypothetical protein